MQYFLLTQGAISTLHKYNIPAISNFTFLPPCPYTKPTFTLSTTCGHLASAHCQLIVRPIEASGLRPQGYLSGQYGVPRGTFVQPPGPGEYYCDDESACSFPILSRHSVISRIEQKNPVFNILVIQPRLTAKQLSSLALLQCPSTDQSGSETKQQK